MLLLSNILNSLKPELKQNLENPLQELKKTKQLLESCPTEYFKMAEKLL
jgi:hypothetical protein